MWMLGRGCAAGAVVAACVAGAAAAAPRIERVNVGPAGGESAGGAAWPGLSADGRRVVYASPAGDLVAGDGNGAWDVFLRELPGGATRRLSVSTGGAQGDGDSGLGGDADLRGVAISSDGRYVAFISRARTLVDGEVDPDTQPDVFLHEVDTGRTEKLPGMTGAREVTISANGDFVFAWGADGAEWSRWTGQTRPAPGVTRRMRSADGLTVAENYDNCVRVGPDGSTQYVFGPACMPASDARLRLIDCSDDGRHVVTKINYLLAGTLFESCVYGPLPPPSVQAPCIAGEEGAVVIRPVLSPSGYLYAHVDVETGRAVRVFERNPAGGVWRSLETGAGGEALDGEFGDIDISDSGLVVAVSSATNLVEGDRNGAADVFVLRGLAAAREVEVELEILIDASAGVSGAGYAAMVAGVRAAIEDPRVFPRTGRIALKVGPFDSAVRGGLAWAAPECPCEVPGLAVLMSEGGGLARPGGAGAACLRSVLDSEMPLLGLKPYIGGRRVVLVVGSGAESCGGAAELAAARDRALGTVDEIHAVALDGGGGAFETYRDALVGPAGVGVARAGLADYSDASERIREAVLGILGGPRCEADVNGDGLVDFTDYLAFLELEEAEDCRADLTGDCVVDFGDVLEFLERYDGGC